MCCVCVMCRLAVGMDNGLIVSAWVLGRDPWKLRNQHLKLEQVFEGYFEIYLAFW